MKNLWKSMVMVFACVAMVVSSTNPVFAKGITTTYTYGGKAYTITTSNDGNNVTTVNVKSDDGTSIVILDKKTNVVKMMEVNAQGTIVLNKTMKVAATTITQPTYAVVVPGATLIGNGAEPFWGHAYAVYRVSAKVFNWNLCVSGSACKYNIRENSGNTGDLGSFKSDVISAVKNEALAVAAVGTGVAAAVAGALAAAGTVTVSLIVGLLVALGAGIGAAALFYSAWVDCRDADYQYGRV